MAEVQVRRDRAYYKSPEYKRECRARRAARDGREFRPSGSGGKGRAAGYAAPKIEAPATIARRAWREWIEVRAPRWWINRYRTVRREVGAERRRAAFKARYAADPSAERQRVRRYKDANTARVAEWHATRQRRLSDHGCERISNSVRARLFERALCPYCGAGLDTTGRELDHIIPLARGGRHEARNLVACCADCNRRKGALPFSAWLQQLEPSSRSLARRMFMRRFGEVDEAEVVALTT